MVAWSYSVLDSFETCAWRHYNIKVVKRVTEQQSEQMLHGNQVHKALEHRLKSKTVLPKQFAHYEGFAVSVERAAVDGKLEAEQKLALNGQYRPTTFFAKDVYVRVITDFTVVKRGSAFIGDWKTGNPNPNSAQLRLSAAATFATLPFVEKITNSFVWLKTGQVTTEKFTRADVPAIWQEFAPRVQRLEIAHAEEKWPKKPSGLCRKHCPVPKSLCEFSGG